LVVDLSRLLPGPLAARLLADLGARVIKVEEPRLGDPVRRAPPLVGGRGALAAILLSGVESVALDLKRPAAREVLDALLGRADVLLATFRPGGLARLGLDPEDLTRRHPRLVVCSLTGWGETGPWAARAGHDLTYQAAAGALASTASMPPLPAADLTGAWSAVTAILAALVARATTGRGARIDASLYDAALHANLVAWSERAAGERDVGDPGALTGALPCYRIYETADGKLVAVAALEPHFWRRLCTAAGRRDLRRRQYDRSPGTHRRVAEMFAERRLAEWTELAAAHDLPLEPVAAPATAAAHPQAADRAVLGTGPEGLPRLAFPARLDGTRPAAATRFPALGEDTKAVLAELGITKPRGSRATTGIGPRRSLRRLLATWIAGRR
jgi:crotonobetainyl-CoA:carnitine CoA-transferase CaiB-like acyl-CoA transferase